MGRTGVGFGIVAVAQRRRSPLFPGAPGWRIMTAESPPLDPRIAPPMSTLDLFRDEADTRSVAAGEIIFLEGEAGRSMYVVLEGQVRLSVTGRSVEKVAKGGVFGEMALIDSSPRSATATALTDCILVPVTEARFKSLVRDNPGFALEIMRVMAARLRSMDRRL
jgi:CRP/FNR family transcriptional regulator, cyclic AMP receptor protein